MKKKPRRFHIFFAMAISLFFLVGPADLYCEELEETDLFSGKLVFENRDQKDLLIDQQKKPKILGMSLFCLTFVLETKLLDELPFLFFPIPSANQPTSILRC